MERGELPHAPPATGMRFSGAEASEIKGGKSADCNDIGDICCDGVWRGMLECEGAPLRHRGGEMGDIVRELLSE
jgi:hypothetical protein